MATEKKDIWSTESYQDAASFVPKLAGKIIGWLDPQKDDAILDIGCGDGIINVQIAKDFAQGTGRIHGVDQSPKMIEAAKKAAADAGLTNCTFDAYDCNDLVDRADLQKAEFTKAFSNAAMHWILRDEAKHEQFFRGVQGALQPGGVFAFEMGGLGNVTELVTAIIMGVSRRIGLEATLKANPWFFPDEAWIRDIMEKRVGGWKVEKIEREWRPTPADAGGVNGWIRLMARHFLDAVPEAEREACTKEIVEVLEYTTKQPSGGNNLNYVRLRVLARKI